MARPARQIARKHHYVPEMYLSGFVNDDGHCFAIDASTLNSFRSLPKGISAKRDYNLIEFDGVPPDALEIELGKFEGVIAPGIRRVRETGSFGQNGVDREDIINLVTLLAVRNPRMRSDLEKMFTELFQTMVAIPFEDKARWESVVEGLKSAGRWPKDQPSDFEGHKKFVEENKDKLKVHKNFSLEMELEALPQIYPYFDARKWRILKAAADAGEFVTTDHPVCVHRPADGINYGQQFAPGFGLADRDVLFSLSSKVAIVGRVKGEEDALEVGRHCVASFNATVMGFAMKQIYASDDQFFYTRAVGQPLGRGFSLLTDPNLKVREDGQ